MIIFLSIVCTILCFIVIFLLWKTFQLIDQIEQYEQHIEEYDSYLDKVKKLLDNLHLHFSKISQYHVASNDPIVQKLTNLVSTARDSLYNLIENIDYDGQSKNSKED